MNILSILDNTHRRLADHPANHMMFHPWMRGRRGWNRHTFFHKRTMLLESMRHIRQIRAGQLSGRCGPRLRSLFVSEQARLSAQRMVL